MRLTLSEGDLIVLERESWIDIPTAERWGLHRANSSEGAALIGRSDRADYSGLVFPVFWPGDPAPKERLLRRDHPDLEPGSNGTLKARGKYLAPPGRGNRLLFGPNEAASVLTDKTMPMILVEGLKKTVAAWRLARWESLAPRFLACGLTGVWNFRGTIGKATDASGARVSIKGVIPDMDRVTWIDRDVSILFDSDAEVNPSVSAAREVLAEELRTRGARVVVMGLPALEGLDKTGFDDLLADWGPERVLDWLETAQTSALALREDPEPISLDALNVPSFPTALLPTPWLRGMVEATSAATETPVELSSLLAFAVVATAVQRKFIVEPAPGYREPLSLWVLALLDSGCRKSAVHKELTAPLLDFERHHAAALAPEIARIESARHLAEERIKHLRQKAAKADGADLDFLRHELFEAESTLPEVPKSLRLWCQDVTPEKLAVLMADHGEAMAILSDEGGIFEILAGRYARGIPNLDLFLKAHSGTAYRVDRGCRPSVFMDSPALTLGLSPQPAVLNGLVKIPGFRGKGLLARFFFALPSSPLGHRTLDSRPVPVEVREAYHQAITQLLQLRPQEGGQPHRLRFSDEAFREWKAFQRHVEDELRDGGTFEHIRDWAGKLPGAVARLAGILHCADHAGGDPHAGPIELPVTESALAIGALLERHALAAFCLMDVDSTLDEAQKVWAWGLRQRQATFSQRECFHALQGTFHEMAAIRPAFEILGERGYLFPLPIDKRVGRPSPRYRVNSRIAKEWQNGMA